MAKTIPAQELKEETPSYDKMWGEINKSIGGQSFFRADEEVEFDVDVIPSPSIAMGHASAIWGVPRKKITQFHGAQGSGKSFLAMLYIVEAQKEVGAEQLLIDTEDSFNMEWAKLLGIDLKRLRILKTNNGADVFRALCGRSNKEGKKMYQGVTELVAEGKMNVNLIVLDSIADMQPPAEENRDFDEMEMAALARFLPRALRVLRPKLAKANIAMITINHLRDGMNGGQPDFPGGRGYKHNLDMAVRVHASTAADGTLFDPNDKEKKIGHKVILTFEKNRFNVNKRQAEVWLDFRKGITRIGEEVAMAGASYGVITRPNNRTWVLDDHNIVGKENFFELLDTDHALRNSVILRIKEAAASGKGISADLELSEEAMREKAKPSLFEE